MPKHERQRQAIAKQQPRPFRGLNTLTSAGADVGCGWMNSDFLSDFRAFVSLLWQYRPIFVVLVGVGFVVFILLVVDAHRHRKKQKGRHKRLH